MSLNHILLGLLQTPATGYDLKRIFDEGIGHFWAAEISQIYTSLKRLESEGLLRSWKEPSDKGPERKVYEITLAGREALASWLTSGPQLGDSRYSYLAQVYLMNALADLEGTLRFMQELRARFAAELERLREKERRWAAEDPRYPDYLPPSLLHVQMVLQLGLTGGEAQVRWCDDCIAKLQARLSWEKESVPDEPLDERAS